MPNTAKSWADNFGIEIGDGLRAYSDLSGGELGFSKKAARLLSGDSKPYLAMSKTPFTHRGKLAGVLSVIALASGDHTGVSVPDVLLGSGRSRISKGGGC